MDILKELQREAGVAILMVTHDRELAGRSDRIVRMQDGEVTGMKKILATVYFSLVLLPAFLSGSAIFCLAADPVHIDVLYLNHGPLQSTLEQMRATFSSYEDKIQVNWHDFESEDGAAFKAQKGIKTHVPLQIWLNGKDTLVVGGKKVRFFGFPIGAGPGFFQGQWSLNDLSQAIAALTTGR